MFAKKISAEDKRKEQNLSELDFSEAELNSLAADLSEEELDPEKLACAEQEYPVENNIVEFPENTTWLTDDLREAVLAQDFSSLSKSQLLEALTLIFNLAQLDPLRIADQTTMDNGEVVEALLAKKPVINDRTRLELLEKLTKQLRFVEAKQTDATWGLFRKAVIAGEAGLASLTLAELRKLLSFFTNYYDSFLTRAQLKNNDREDVFFADHNEKISFLQSIDRHIRAKEYIEINIKKREAEEYEAIRIFLNGDKLKATELLKTLPTAKLDLFFKELAADDAKNKFVFLSEEEKAELAALINQLLSERSYLQLKPKGKKS